MNETKNGFYRRDGVIAPSMCDASFSLGIAQQFALVQDIAAEHAQRRRRRRHDGARRVLACGPYAARIL